MTCYKTALLSVSVYSFLCTLYSIFCVVTCNKSCSRLQFSCVFIVAEVSLVVSMVKL